MYRLNKMEPSVFLQCYCSLFLRDLFSRLFRGRNSCHCFCVELVKLLPVQRYSVYVNVLLTVPRRYFFCGSFMFFFCLVFAMSCARLFICASWSPAGKGLTSWLSFVVSSVSLSLSHWYPGSGVVLDCIDS